MSMTLKMSMIFENFRKKKLLAFYFQKTEEETKKWSTLNSLFTQKKKKKTQIIFHHGAEFFLLEQRLVHEDIRADTSQRSRCVRYSFARAFAFFLFFSLSTEEDRGNHRRRIS